MRVTEKGQVTIPKPIRDKLGIVPGSEVEFLATGEVVRLVLAEGPSVPPTDPVEKRAWYETHFARMRGGVDTMGMDGKAYIDWLRGPRDDLDPS